MGKVRRTYDVRRIEIMLYDGVSLYIVDQTWLPRTNDEIAQLAGRAEVGYEGACQRAC